MNQTALEKLSSLNWPEITKRLMGIAIFWSKMYHGTSWKSLPKGYTHEDIVQESIRRAFSKDWDSFTEDEVIQYLFGAARSVLSALAKSAKTQKTDRSDLFSIEVIDDAQRIEEKFERAEFIQKIRQELGVDDDLVNLFDDILLGLEPQEIAEKRSVPVKQIYNMKKRLLRIAEKIAKEV